MAVGSGSNPNRQRMINLMYLVFIAMMALNVSPEVLDGFSLVEGELRQATLHSEAQNARLASDMQAAFTSNPEKVRLWQERSRELQLRSDSLYTYIQSLKQAIAVEADGKGANPESLQRRDDLSASSVVLLGPIRPKGTELRQRIEGYCSWVSTLFGQGAQGTKIIQRLSTPSGKQGKSWEEEHFENIPAIAAVTLLTNLQSNIRYIEGEALAELLKGIDAHDYRSNQLTAQVIPESRIVLRGTPYQASIVLSSIDTTKHPKIFVNGSLLPATSQGKLTLSTPTLGNFPLKGHIETELHDGTLVRSNFESSYTVIEPTATIAPTMMNVLYAGIDNPIRIAVPGIALQDISATISSGSLTRKGDLWIAHPTKAGGEVTIAVTARTPSGQMMPVAQSKLRVRSLPDPMPYLALTSAKGDVSRFKGGRIAKSSLLVSGGVKAAIDDSFLEVNYTVLRFQLIAFDSMGNALPEASAGANFSERQLRQIQNTPRGRRLYITGIIARGPDGIERQIPSLELIIG